jgi:hypothetical protein
MKPHLFATDQQAARLAAFPLVNRPVRPVVHRLSPIARVDRYLAIVARARRLCARSGWVAVSIGLNPARYTRIERAAWNRYCRDNPEIS